MAVANPITVVGDSFAIANPMISSARTWTFGVRSLVSGLLVALMAFEATPYLFAGHKQCVPPNISVSKLQAEWQKKVKQLPERDREDTSSLPLWFRIFIRAQLSGLSVAGERQYPSGSVALFDWLVKSKCVSKGDLDTRLAQLQDEIAASKKGPSFSDYPPNWNVPVKAGSRLEIVVKQLQEQAEFLPANDLQDRSPLPIWFRVYLRKVFPDLPKSGPYQYPRTANRILQELLDHPDDVQLSDTPKQ
jgi:hypothetical protein